LAMPVPHEKKQTDKYHQHHRQEQAKRD
jgi:hypothetical protein